MLCHSSISSWVTSKMTSYGWGVYLLLSSDDEHSEHRQDGAIHRHRRRQTAQVNVVKKQLQQCHDSLSYRCFAKLALPVFDYLNIDHAHHLPKPNHRPSYLQQNRWRRLPYRRHPQHEHCHCRTCTQHWRNSLITDNSCGVMFRAIVCRHVELWLPSMCGKVKRDAEPLLAGLYVFLVECVTLLHRTESRVLKHTTINM